PCHPSPACPPTTYCSAASHLALATRARPSTGGAPRGAGSMRSPPFAAFPSRICRSLDQLGRYRWLAAAGGRMIVRRSMVTGLLVLGTVAPASAAHHCFSRKEQRAKTAAPAVVPLSRAIRQVKPHGDVIRARLCDHDGHLVYLLTIFGTDGKVAQASIDAANGALL